MNNKRIRLAIVGTGSRGMSFGKRMSRREDVELKAVCDVNSVRMDYFVSETNQEACCYKSLEEMCAKEELDALIITSPDRFHREHAITAIREGLHVLIDKPLAITVSGCREILDAAEKARKTVMIGFNLRHNPVLNRLKGILDDGMLGRVFLIENREFYHGGRTYMSRWNRRYEVSGGLWVHKGSHDFDVFNWLFGFPRPVKVSATAGNAIFTPENIPFKTDPEVPAGPNCTDCAYFDKCPDRYDIPADHPAWGKEAAKEDGYVKNLCMYMSDKSVHDHGIATVEYENGMRASHLECFTTSYSNRLYTIVGEKGQAEVSLGDLRILVRPRWSSEEIIFKIPQAQGGHGGSDPLLHEKFIEIVKGDAKNTSTAEHGLLSTAVGQAAEISWREDRTVFVDELF